MWHGNINVNVNIAVVIIDNYVRGKKIEYIYHLVNIQCQFHVKHAWIVRCVVVGNGSFYNSDLVKISRRLPPLPFVVSRHNP